MGGVNWPQADLDAHYARLRGEQRISTFNSLSGEEAVKLAAIGRKLPKPRMNKTEAAYACWLTMQRLCGAIERFEFEGISLQLAPSTWYTPDFHVVTAHGVELHEVKGFMREAARVRLNVAAAKFTEFKFYLVRAKLVADGGGFDVRLVGGEE